MGIIHARYQAAEIAGVAVDVAEPAAFPAAFKGIRRRGLASGPPPFTIERGTTAQQQSQKDRAKRTRALNPREQRGAGAAGFGLRAHRACEDLHDGNVAFALGERQAVSPGARGTGAYGSASPTHRLWTVPTSAQQPRLESAAKPSKAFAALPVNRFCASASAARKFSPLRNSA